MYRAEQWKVLEALGSEVPKRPTSTVSGIVEAGFKRKDNADRIVRNALRKPRAEGHIEIAERGEYRLTQKGASFLATARAEGYKPEAPRKASKKVAKKVAKKATKKAAKKKVTKKAAAKKAAPKKAAAKKAAPKAAAKQSTAGKGNGISKKPKEPTGATLSF